MVYTPKYRRNSRGDWYPLNDLRENPSGEPIFYEWMVEDPSFSFRKLARCVYWFFVITFTLSLMTGNLLAAAPLLVFGIITWVRKSE